MARFALNKLYYGKDPLTGHFTLSFSKEYRITTFLFSAIYLGLILTGYFQDDAVNLLSVVVIFVLFLLMAIPLWFGRKNGWVDLQKNQIIAEPVSESDHLPDHPIPLGPDTEIKIYTLNKYRLLSFFALIQFEIYHQDKLYTLGIVLDSDKDKEQYLNTLDSWYRKHLNIKEYDKLGKRVFKLNKGKDYEEIQQIKKEYGISW